MQDRNFKSSGVPNICSAETPSILRTSSVQCLSRAPRTECFKYASASCREEMPYLFAIGLCPSTLSWGKINHIQWLCFRPFRSSPDARSNDSLCASTKRCKSYGSSVFALCPVSVIVFTNPDWSASNVNAYLLVTRHSPLLLDLHPACATLNRVSPSRSCRRAGFLKWAELVTAVAVQEESQPYGRPRNGQKSPAPVGNSNRACLAQCSAASPPKFRLIKSKLPSQVRSALCFLLIPHFSC